MSYTLRYASTALMQFHIIQTDIFLIIYRVVHLVPQSETYQAPLMLVEVAFQCRIIEHEV